MYEKIWSFIKIIKRKDNDNMEVFGVSEFRPPPPKKKCQLYSKYQYEYF